MWTKCQFAARAKGGNTYPTAGRKYRLIRIKAETDPYPFFCQHSLASIQVRPYCWWLGVSPYFFRLSAAQMPTSSPCYRSLCGWTVDFLCHRRPIPWQQFVEAVDLVVMDAVENVGQIGLRIEAVDLCGLDPRQPAQGNPKPAGRAERIPGH